MSERPKNARVRKKTEEPAPPAEDSGAARPPNGQVSRSSLEQVLRTGFGLVLKRLDVLASRVDSLEATLAKGTVGGMPALDASSGPVLSESPAASAEPPAPEAPTPAPEAPTPAPEAPTPAPAAEAEVEPQPSQEPPPTVPPAPEEEGPLRELVWGRPTPQQPRNGPATDPRSDRPPDERRGRLARSPRMPFGRRETQSE